MSVLIYERKPDLNARVPGSRMRILIEPATRKVVIDWLTGAAPSAGTWEEGDPIIEIAKQQDVAARIGVLVNLSVNRLVVDL